MQALHGGGHGEGDLGTLKSQRAERLVPARLPPGSSPGLFPEWRSVLASPGPSGGVQAPARSAAASAPSAASASGPLPRTTEGGMNQSQRRDKFGVLAVPASRLAGLLNWNGRGEAGPGVHPAARWLCAGSRVLAGPLSTG